MRKIPEKILNDLDEWGNAFFYANKRSPTLDEVNEYLALIVKNSAEMPLEDFDGYTPSQMGTAKRFPLDKDAILSVRNLEREDFEQIPLFRQIKKLSDILFEKESIKLTATGSLPSVIVAEVYVVGNPSWEIEAFPKKVLKQMDCATVERTFIMMNLLKITKVQKNILTLTKKGKQLLESPQELLVALLNVFLYEFNWGYFDRYYDDDIHPQLGNFAAFFSFLMVARYGDTWHNSDFYAEKYFKAYPFFLDQEKHPMFDSINSCYRCYKKEHLIVLCLSLA